MKLKESEALPEVLKMWVLKHPTLGYLSRIGWDKSLQKARKWNRKSDATQTKNSRYGSDIKDTVVVCVSFTHGFQAIQ